MSQTRGKAKTASAVQTSHTHRAVPAVELQQRLRDLTEAHQGVLEDLRVLRRAKGDDEERLTAVEEEIDRLRDQLSEVRDAAASRSAGWTRSGKRMLRAAMRRRYAFSPNPLRHVREVEGGALECCGEDPQILLSSLSGRYPYGWTRMRLHVEAAEEFEFNLRLYYDRGNGFNEVDSQLLPVPASQRGALDFVQYLPPDVERLRLDPSSHGKGRFVIRDIEIQEITKQEAFVFAGINALKDGALKPKRLARAGRKLMQTYRHGGIAGMVADLQAHTRSGDANYDSWVRAFDTLTEADRTAIRARIEAMPHKPVISVVMPVYNAPEAFLRRAIESVTQQIYPYWELCIADDCSPKPHVLAVLQELAANEPRIKFERRAKNGHISAASNTALKLATGEFVALLDHDDEFSEHALYMVAEEINAHPQVGVIYSDEDKLDENSRRRDPYFKPDWNIDLLYSQNFVSHLGVYRRSLLQEIDGFREGYEGSQDYDLLLRAVEKLDVAQIRHIPHVLYHWRAIEGSTALASGEKPYAYIAAEKAIMSHLTRSGVRASVTGAGTLGLYRVRYALPDAPHHVTLIIPTRDRVDLLRRCVDSILKRTSYAHYDIIIVDNQSREASTKRYFESLQKNHNVRVLSFDKPFNYAAMNNMAVAEADGSVVGLLNNDLEVINDDWLQEMLSHALRPNVGAVGAKLYYPNHTVQHGGVVFGIGGIASHAHKHLPVSSPGYFGRANLLQSFSAVTAACMLVRRDLYTEVGGLDEDFRVAYNDLDFCLRLRERGYRNIWTPYARLVHYESASRGADTAPDKVARFEAEMAKMRERWGQVIADDPGYNPNLTLHAEDFSLAFPSRAQKPWQAD